MLEVYLNDAAPECRCLVFPPQKRGQQTAVGTDGQMAVIREVRSSMACLDAHMEGKVLRPGQGIRELEFLDRHTEGMTEREKTIFQAALDIECCPPNYLHLLLSHYFNLVLSHSFSPCILIEPNSSD